MKSKRKNINLSKLHPKPKKRKEQFKVAINAKFAKKGSNYRPGNPSGPTPGPGEDPSGGQ